MSKGWLRVQCNISETPATQSILDLTSVVNEALAISFLGASGILIHNSTAVSGSYHYHLLAYIYLFTALSV